MVGEIAFLCMVPDSSPSRSAGPPYRDTQSNIWINALIGAVAGILLSFIPLSTVLGGAIAGYLEGGEFEDGLKVGAIAGLIMLLPFMFFGLFFMIFFLGFGMEGFLVFSFLLFFVMIFGVVYTMAFSAVGGYLGVYLKHEL